MCITPLDLYTCIGNIHVYRTPRFGLRVAPAPARILDLGCGQGAVTVLGDKYDNDILIDDNNAFVE